MSDTGMNSSLINSLASRRKRAHKNSSVFFSLSAFLPLLCSPSHLYPPFIIFVFFLFLIYINLLFLFPRFSLICIIVSSVCHSLPFYFSSLLISFHCSPFSLHFLFNLSPAFISFPSSVPSFLLYIHPRFSPPLLFISFYFSSTHIHLFFPVPCFSFLSICFSLTH